ncbi:MAG TPA: beta galactosidase jelly roll domain-containing protein [Prolixibacteraceae bacterium]|nr:beta galactosidase jelly roll domain-containing protein [Prolixibacteraceae bacterium]
MKNLYYTLLLVMVLGANPLSASKWGRVVNLKGLWHFSVGDDQRWANRDFDSRNWDKLQVPSNLDDFYRGYNGYAWYRRNFDINTFPDQGELVLKLGQIDDVDEVFINGVKIGQTGSFPPNFKTAYNVERLYVIPEGILRNENNLIAVRVYDTSGPGGIVGGDNIGIFYDNDHNLLSFDLSGKWKFSIYRERGVYDIGFDDSRWNEINVPEKWDTQGYADYDGYAWYRTKFIMPAQLTNKDMYLVLGKIDDFDKVYLNGALIGRTEYLEQYSSLNKGAAHRLYRVYKIPLEKLRTVNVLVVEVRDEQLDGGIYEGPVGLMTGENARVFEERNREQVWSNPISRFLRFFDIY